MRLTRIFAVLFMLSFSLLSINAQDATPPQARVRLANYVIDAEEIDFLLNGESIGTLAFRAPAQHQPIYAGTHTLTVTLVGDETTLIEPFTLELEPNHDYTLALIGQLADGSAQVLVLDETTIVAEVRDLNNPASYAILLHGISDGPTVDFTMDGETLMQNLSFGQYDVVTVTLEPHNILVTFSDDPSQILFQNNNEVSPSNDLLLLTVMVGAYPDNLDVTGAVSRLPDRNVLDFLAGYPQDAEHTFSILLEAIEIAGLTDTFTQEGVYTLFAPTNSAFEALPQATRDLLFAYPDALKAVLLGHISPAIFTTRELTDSVTVETLGGTAVTIESTDTGLTINGNASLLFGGFPVVTNGNVIGIDQILIPQS
jgi:uncharacterized surface protein with fasciclin (FAS1) repeats